MASDFMDRVRFNTKNTPDFFYIQNLKKKPTETFREYVTHWRSEAANVKPSLDEEQMNKFVVRAQDPQYYERLMVIENHKFSDIIKLGERIEEGIKSGIVTNFEALQAKNKALQSGSISKKKDVGAAMVAQRLRYSCSRCGIRESIEWVNPNKTCVFHSGMKGHTTDECRALKDKIQTLIDNKFIQSKEATPNVRNNPLPDHRGGGIHVIETNEEWVPKGSIGLIREGDDFKPSFTLAPIVVQTQSPIEVEVAASVPFEVEVAPLAATPVPFEEEVVAPFTVIVSTIPPFNSKSIPWDYIAEARQKGKAKMEESKATQGMTRTGRIYTPKYLEGPSKDATAKQPIIEIGPDDIWRKVQATEYSSINHLNKTPSQISILSLLQNSEAHKNALMKVLSEAYVPNNITSGEMANMVGQVLESHKITFHEDELPPEGLNHNRALHITVQYEDYFITRVLIDRVSSLNIFPLTTPKRLGKGLYEIQEETMNVKAFDGFQRATIGEINICLQMGPTWFDVEFQEVTIHGDGNNPIYTSQTILVIKNRRRLGGETYHHIERVNAVEKDKWWNSKIESMLAWSGYEPSKGLGKNLQGITKQIQLKEEEALAGLKNLFLEDEDMDYNAIIEEEEEEGLTIKTTCFEINARFIESIIITFFDEPVTVTCNEATKYEVSDSDEEDEILEEVVREVENFENKPKSNLDETEAINLGDVETVKETRGVYCYKMMPFRLKNDGATYMKAMTTIFNDIIHKEIEVYVDDVIIKSKRVTDHIANLRKFFDRFPCTNNMAEYEAYILGLNIAVDINIQELLIIGDSDLFMQQHLDKNFIDLIPVRVHNQPPYCAHVKEETDGKPWFHDVKEYLAEGEYSEYANHTRKRTLRRLSNHFFHSGGNLYRRTPIWDC
ncbi:uncharacterized protein [Nicotiana sylvestris]|uniref:uncharacterized protein n=1 Tax=Nicotiana sylvestris TaxID=4096 RepID=UPI00388C995F